MSFRDRTYATDSDAAGGQAIRARKFSLVWALVGFVTGCLVVTLAGYGLWWVRVIPARNLRPVELTAEALPGDVLGFQRDDLELMTLPAEDAAAAAARQGIYQASLREGYRLTYGGEGVTTNYGRILAAESIEVTAVNGALDPKVAISDSRIEHIRGLPAYQWVAVPVASTSTRCVFGLSTAGHLAEGQTAEQFTAELVDSTAQPGSIECMRRSVDRNLSVRIIRSIREDNVAGRTVGQMADEIAMETNRVWEALD